jgi:molybdenum-dependent DNA-binding transcriptional regulator ModE
MSIKHMTSAWNEKELTSTEKLVFLAICDNANDEGICYPSIATLAEKTGFSTRAICGAIKRLEKHSVLLSFNRARKTGGRYSTLYLVYPLENFSKLDEEYREKFAKKYNEMTSEKDSQMEPRSHGFKDSQMEPCSKKEGSQMEPRSISYTYIEPSLIYEPSLKEKSKKKKDEDSLYKLELFRELSKEEKELYLEYIELRKEMKLKTTPAIHSRLLRKYFDFGRDISVIESAIAANWRDFYPVKKSTSHKPQKTLGQILEEIDTTKNKTGYIDTEEAS